MQIDLSIPVDAELLEQFTELCEFVGMNVETAFNIFMVQSVRENKIPKQQLQEGLQG